MKNIHFVGGILFVIALAKLAPSIGNSGGILKPEITVKYIAVSSIFVISGLTLPTDELKSAALQWDLHLFIQGFTFVVFPGLMYCLVYVLKYTFLHEGILQGMMILSYMPPPVSSAIILTKAVGGNEAGAVFNSVLGSLMGIFITPTLILMSHGSNIDVDTSKIFVQLLSTCLLPLIVGQLFRNYNYEWLVSQSFPYKDIGNGLILFIIYTTFCSTFSRDDISVDITSLVVTIILILILQICIMLFLLNFSSCSAFSFQAADSITITFCGTHKSLTLGIPVIDIIFSNDPNLIFYSIPLLVYNPLQIVLGGMSIPLFHEWLLEIRRARRLQKTWYRANANTRTRRVR